MMTLEEIRKLVAHVDEIQEDYDERGETHDITSDEWHWMDRSRELAKRILRLYGE